MRKSIRPTKYSRVLGEAICARLAQGESLRRIADDATMPELATLAVWLERHPSFRAAYERAREIEADILADDVLDIADGDAADNATAAKLRVDARKWLAAKLKPATYGECKAAPRKAPARPVVFKVTTGIPKAPDEAQAEDEEGGETSEPAESEDGT
jgi:hypothetical protein